jgi:HAD superfamily hydrolase (TIGR01509 family)
MIRNIIWDVDGTLFDTYPAIVGAFSMALRDLGSDAPPATIHELALVSLDHCVSVLAGDHGLSSSALEDAFSARYAECAASDSPPFPGVADVCRYVRAIGGSNVIVTHRRRASTEVLLAANDMRDQFAGIVTAEEGHPRKPDPAMFELALVDHGLARAETMSIGDRALDVDAAQAAGLFSCLYGSRLDAAHADLIVEGYDHLLRYLEDVNAGASVAGIASVAASRDDVR